MNTTRKIRLDLEALEISSFATSELGADPGGTVHAHEMTAGPSCRQSCEICDITMCGCSASCQSEQTICGSCR